MSIKKQAGTPTYTGMEIAELFGDETEQELLIIYELLAEEIYLYTEHEQKVLKGVYKLGRYILKLCEIQIPHYPTLE